MADEVLVSDEQEGVRILTLNRPEKRNALNTALTRAIVVALEAADADDGVRAIVLRGAGRGFCAGADISEFKDLTIDQAEKVAERAVVSHRMYSCFRSLKKPVVSAVHGAALGGGAAIALACDMTVVSDDLQIGFPEIRHSIIPALIMPILQRQIPMKIAFDLISSGRVLGAGEANELRIVNRVVASDALVAAAMKIAGSWAKASPQAMAAVKSLFYRVADLSFQDAMQAGREENIRMRGFRERSDVVTTSNPARTV
jgi:enoyl-CoA hydratase/carnithine racemase